MKLIFICLNGENDCVYCISVTHTKWRKQRNSIISRFFYYFNRNGNTNKEYKHKKKQKNLVLKKKKTFFSIKGSKTVTTMTSCTHLSDMITKSTSSADGRQCSVLKLWYFFSDSFIASIFCIFHRMLFFKIYCKKK